MAKEIWKDIDGYGGAYQVSNQGNVFVRESYVQAWGGAQRKKPHILKCADNGNGYRYVTISVNRKRKNHYVHVLVAKAFIPNPENKEEVNHINGNKSDNKMENLEWCTRKENLMHASRAGLLRTGSNNPQSRPVYNSSGEKLYDSVKIAARALKMNYGTLKDALRKNVWYRGMTYTAPLMAKEKGLSESRLIK